MQMTILLTLLEDERYSAVVGDFRRLVKTPRLERLLVRLVERRSSERAGQWPDKRPPGFIPLWSLLYGRAEEGGLSGEAVWQQLKRAYEIAVPKNLTVVATLEEFLVAATDVRDLLSADSSRSYRGEAKEFMRKLLAATYEGKEAELVHALDGAAGPILSWVTWGLERRRTGKLDGVPFDDWKPFADTIVKAVRIDRSVMLPQLASLVTDETHTLTGSGLRYEFAPERAARLFGDAQIVLDLFVDEDVSEWRIPNVLEIIRAGQAPR